jgi:phytoene dehydrogenase-like protein
MIAGVNLSYPPTVPRNSFDAIVVGSGHNALVTSAYLAKAGWSVLVLERNDRPGGLVRTEELTEPGFRHDTYSTAHPLFTSGPAYAELAPELSRHGLEYHSARYWSGVSMPREQTAVVSTNPEANIAEADRLAPGDGAALSRLLANFAPLAEPVFGLFSSDLSTPAAAKVINKLLHDSTGGMSNFAHLFTLSPRDLLEQNFASPVLRGMLAPWAMHLGRGPDEVNGGLWVLLVHLACTAAGMPIPVGGSERLATALVSLIEQHSGAVQCGQKVRQVLVDGGRAVGVRTTDGESFTATRAVIASVNPDQLYLHLLEHEESLIPPAIRWQARGYRYGRGCVQIHLALSEPPRFDDVRLNDAGQPHLTDGLDGLSRSVNEAARGLLPVRPTISFDAPSTVDPTRCPPGKAVARLQILDVPARLRGDADDVIDTDGGWTHDVKQAFADRVLKLAYRHVANLEDAIIDRYVIGPDDLARYNPNCGPGDPYGGSHDLAQSYVFRPLPGQPSHQTVLPNLFMVGAATWPGHGVNGASGYIVAKRLLA